jgi:hypothetical protein
MNQSHRPWERWWGFEQATPPKEVLESANHMPACRRQGIMEWWNNGIMGKDQNI